MIRFIISLVILLSLNVIVIDSVNKDNVCLYTEKYNVTVQRFYPKNVTIRESGWCKTFPFRCITVRTVVKNNTKIETEERTRDVEKCCPGYEKSKTGAVECHPVCEQECQNGICIGPNVCSCFPGFTGKICEEECPAGRWGLRCSQKCECQHENFCSPMSGKCTCTPNWTGPLCETPVETTTPNHTTELVQETLPPKISEPESTTSRISPTTNAQEIDTTTKSIETEKATDIIEILNPIEITTIPVPNTTVTNRTPPVTTETSKKPPITTTTSRTPSATTEPSRTRSVTTETSRKPQVTTVTSWIAPVTTVTTTPQTPFTTISNTTPPNKEIPTNLEPQNTTEETTLGTKNSDPSQRSNNQPSSTKITEAKTTVQPQTTTVKSDQRLTLPPDVIQQETNKEIITIVRATTSKPEAIEINTKIPEVHIFATKKIPTPVDDRNPKDNIIKTSTEFNIPKYETTTVRKKEQNLFKLENNNIVSTIIPRTNLLKNTEYSSTESNADLEIQTVIPIIEKAAKNSTNKYENTTKIIKIKKKCKSKHRNTTETIKSIEDNSDQNVYLQSMISEEDLDHDTILTPETEEIAVKLNRTHVKIIKKKCKKNNSIESGINAGGSRTTERNIQEYTTSYFIENYVDKVKFGEKFANFKVSTILTIIPGVFLTIALIAMIIVLTIRYRARKKVVLKCIEMSKMDNRKSIFHYPLPDPPTFQITNFSLEEDNIKNTKKLNCMAQDFSNQNNDIVDFQYDYPKPTMESFRPSEPSYLEPRNLNNSLDPIHHNIAPKQVAQISTISLENSEMEIKPLDGADFPYYDEVPPARNIFDPKNI